MTDRPAGSKSRAVTPGLVVVDKPAGWTSHDVVGKLRRIFGTRKVGHSGTLDPMATGVLVCGVGQATRLLGFVSDSGKEYDATIRLGVTSTTDDAEGEFASLTGANLAPVAGSELGPELVPVLEESAIRAALALMVGEIDQRPSSVSAIKIDGERAYAKVRRGEQVELPARRVTISKIEVHEVRAGSYQEPDREPVVVVDLDVTVACSSGTYIRAIARDLGAELGVGGILTSLRRIQVGEFGVAQAHTLDELTKTPHLDALATALPRLFATTTLDQESAAKFCNGGKVSLEAVDSAVREVLEQGSLVGVLDSEGRAIGVAEQRKGALAPKIVWPE